MKLISGGGGSLPSLTDTGALVTSTSPLVLPAGAATSGALALQIGAANYGFYKAATSIGINPGGSTANEAFHLSSDANAGLVIYSAGFLSWVAANDASSTTSDTFFGRRSAANFRFGSTDGNGAVVSQTLSVQNAITGSNLTPGVFTIAAPLGTGTGAGSATKFQRGLMQASGTTAHTNVDAIVIGESKTLSNTSATTTALASISVPSNSGGGCSGFITVVASDGTNFDSETQSFNVSYVNKATVLTIGTPAITASTAASNSGSTTIGLTVTAGTNAVNINVTPVFTTIVPTTVTAFLEIHNHGTGNVTIN